MDRDRERPRLVFKGGLSLLGPARNFPAGAVYSLHRDADGGLWLGTLGKGLVLFRGGQFRTLTMKDGLFDDVIFQILEDATGYLWMSSNRGIFRVSRRELEQVADGRRSTVTSRVFGTADGMESKECNGGNQPAGLKARDGRLWFPTLKGSVVVDPQRLRTNTVPPRVLIEEGAVDKRPLGSSGESVFPPGPGALEFRYTALALRNPDRVRFRYRLEGFDKQWVDAGTRRVAYYTNTPPGRYRFQVTASNEDGVWSEQGATAAFRLRPHLHQTPWFLAVCAVGVLLLGERSIGRAWGPDAPEDRTDPAGRGADEAAEGSEPAHWRARTGCSASSPPSTA